eukprot:2340095-Prymnesium_polylepis.1
MGATGGRHEGTALYEGWRRHGQGKGGIRKGRAGQGTACGVGFGQLALVAGARLADGPRKVELESGWATHAVPVREDELFDAAEGDALDEAPHRLVGALVRRDERGGVDGAHGGVEAERRLEVEGAL